MEKIRKILFTPKKIAILHILGGLIFMMGVLATGILFGEWFEREYFTLTIYGGLFAMKKHDHPLLVGTELEKVIEDLERIINVRTKGYEALETKLKELYLGLIYSRFFLFVGVLVGLFLFQKGREILKEVSIKGKMIYFTSFLSLLALIVGIFLFWVIKIFKWTWLA